jgi:hypothetical protein
LITRFEKGVGWIALAVDLGIGWLPYRDGEEIVFSVIDYDTGHLELVCDAPSVRLET